MTVGEVKQLQKQILNHPENKLNSSAVGKYQIVGKTLRGLQKKLGFKDSDKFDTALQDRLGTELLNQRGLGKFKSGKMSASEFQNSLAQEWASVASTSGKALQHTGTTSEQIQAAMAAAKNDTQVAAPTTQTPTAPSVTAAPTTPTAPAVESGKTSESYTMSGATPEQLAYFKSMGIVPGGGTTQTPTAPAVATAASLPTRVPV